MIGVYKLMGKFENSTDPWESFEYKFTPRIFGRGSIHDFGWYLQGAGENVESVDSVDRIVELLLTKFQYKSDKGLLNMKDYWQHPAEFEKRCAGDCEDHSLWVWKKLKEINIPAVFVGGKLCGNRPGFSFHAWVIFTKEGQKYLFETATKDRNKMIFPLQDAYVNASYIPLFGVDHELRTFGFAGLGIMAKKFGFREIFNRSR